MSEDNPNAEFVSASNLFGTGGHFNRANLQESVDGNKSNENVIRTLNKNIANFEKNHARMKSLNVAQNMKNGWTIRNQFGRGTCTAFAVGACIEVLHSSVGVNKEKLSPEFLYWNMRNKAALPESEQDDSYKKGGTKLSQGMHVMNEWGVCHDQLYPYRQSQPDFDAYGDEKFAPTDKAFQDAKLFVATPAFYWDVSFGQLSEGATIGIYKQLEKGFPCAIGVPLFRFENEKTDNWVNAYTLKTGKVFGPEDEQNKDKLWTYVDGHVVCIVGFQPDKSLSSGGWFIFKNSWGTEFGKYPPLSSGSIPQIPASGFGAITAGYVEAHCWEILSLST